MRVHVRKKVRLGDLGRAVRGDAPREVSLLVHATRDAPLVLSIHGTAAPRATTPAVLLRVDLDEPSLARGALEIIATGARIAPATLYLDRGVHLAEGPMLGVREAIGSELPVRVIVDSPKLPTNASRSEVRMDSEVIARVRARIPTALAAAITTLSAMVTGGTAAKADLLGISLGHAVEVLETRREVLEEVLGAIARRRDLRAAGGRLGDGPRRPRCSRCRCW